MNKARMILLIVSSMFITKFMAEALLGLRIYQISKAFSIQMVPDLQWFDLQFFDFTMV